MIAKYQFYEIVKINELSEDKYLVGQEGTVLGMAQNREGRWGYSIALPPTNKCSYFLQEELDATGKWDKVENFYDGTSIIVIVDPDSEEGKIIKYQEPYSS